MKIALRVVALHFAATLALALLAYQAHDLPDHPDVFGWIRFAIGYVALLLFFVINIPGIPVAQMVVPISIDQPSSQWLAIGAVMIPTTEVILFLIALVVVGVWRVLRRAERIESS